MIFCYSCNNSKDKTKYLPESLSKPSEVLFIVEKSQWDSEIGKIIKDNFTQSFKGIPQDEPIFDIIHVKKSSFKNLFTKYKNIVIINIDNNIVEGITIHENVWARPQVVVDVKCKNEANCITVLKSKINYIIDVLYKKSMQNLSYSYKKKNDDLIKEKIKKCHNIELSIPKGFVVHDNLKEEKFSWLSFEPQEISQGIIIYEFKLTNQNITKELLINKRDSVLKKYIASQRPNSYMKTTLPEIINLDSIKIENNDTYIMRGLWSVENDFMGGPFINYTFLDKKNNRVLVIDGYVYAPSKNKRDYVKQLEAIINTIKF